MKLATLRISGAERPAVCLTNGDFVDLTVAAEHQILSGAPIGSVVDLLDDRAPQVANVRRLVDQIETGSDSINDRLRAANAVVPAGNAQLALPVMPKIVLSTGAAYGAHQAEMKVKGPSEPRGFLKSLQSVTGPRDPILLPTHEPDMVDFECEFSCVFGRTCYNVGAGEALDHIAGYTMINDVSSRYAAGDYIASLKGGDPNRSCELSDKNIFGKQFPTFCPIGPVITTKDEIPDPHNVSIGTRLNGELMQSANTNDLIFKLSEVIAFFSRWFRFQPGDVLTTGSPSGVGFARNPQVFMKPGDVVEVFGEGIGSLMNPVELAKA